nr:AraC family transcriptional regulator [uncultured Blautia sp.]
MKNPYELAENILQSVSDGAESSVLSGGFTSIDLYGASVLRKDEDDEDCNSFYLENESGVGNIILYQVFPGIELVYNDMHLAYCSKQQQTSSSVLEINYCKEGRCECLFGEHQYCYMSAGDLSFCFLKDNVHQSEFPTAHYHGITVTIDFAGITDEMKKILELLSVDLERIKEISRMRDFTIIRANSTVEHIFSELYTVPEKIRHGYIRVKVLEILLVLTGLEPGKDEAERVHFSESQIEVIKEIHGFHVEHFNEHYTISQLSERFEISPTIMKKCFKGVYGDSIYAYMKRYRLQVAERLLKESQLTVGEIAAQIGYLNPNKFTSAFCGEYGVPPTSYRKKV